MKEKLKQIGDRLSSFVSSHKKAATITASALLVLAGVLVIAQVLSGGTKKNAQSEDDKKMLKDETVKVDKDKKRVKTRRHLQMAKKMIKKTTRKMPILKLKMLMGKQRIINRVRLTIKQRSEWKYSEHKSGCRKSEYKCRCSKSGWTDPGWTGTGRWKYIWWKSEHSSNTNELRY